MGPMALMTFPSLPVRLGQVRQRRSPGSALSKNNHNAESASLLPCGDKKVLEGLEYISVDDIADEGRIIEYGLLQYPLAFPRSPALVTHSVLPRFFLLL